MTKGKKILIALMVVLLVVVPVAGVLGLVIHQFATSPNNETKIEGSNPQDHEITQGEKQEIIEGEQEIIEGEEKQEDIGSEIEDNKESNSDDLKSDIDYESPAEEEALEDDPYGNIDTDRDSRGQKIEDERSK